MYTAGNTLHFPCISYCAEKKKQMTKFQLEIIIKPKRFKLENIVESTRYVWYHRSCDTKSSTFSVCTNTKNKKRAKSTHK